MSAPAIFNGFTFTDLFQADTLSRLDQDFLAFLQQQDSALAQQLLNYRQQPHALSAPERSELLIACAIPLEQFIAQFFAIQLAVLTTRRQTQAHAPIFHFKKWFVQRRARRRLSRAAGLASFADLDVWLNQKLARNFPDKNEEIHQDKELLTALLGELWLTDKEAYAEEIEQLTQWCIQALLTPEGQVHVKGWASFHLPAQIHPQHLVETVPISLDAITVRAAPEAQRQQRCGFKLTDPRMSARLVQSEIDYCVYCHSHDGDFCSQGFPEQKGEPEQGLKKNALGVVLTGCPLGEKISEMHSLKRDGYSIAALAMVMIDNPMCAATGHRICNDCMKSCIYQKQAPVNIPQIETRVLSDVLALPYGVEIYDLLTRWHPLRPQQISPKPYNGLKVLIAGQGPAGFTLAHHLLMEGFAVVGVDGLKIEPLPAEWLQTPIQDYQQLTEDLDQRIMAGFGGVAEYGITVRWDKNFLRLIYLSLARRPHYQVFGNVRFGGTVTVEDAWALGFDHLAVAVGAGLPQALPIEGSMSVGMRQANDFLMALQLTGAAKASSLANLQIRLPAVVIGGGLTGIDAATELQAYYLVQIEKIAQRYQQLVAVFGEARVREGLDEASLAILCEYLQHARELQAEQVAAEKEGRTPNVQALLHAWGGVTVAYRRSMEESPAYIRNHEELSKALAEGIFYLEGVEPTAVQQDQFGHVSGLRCLQRGRDAQGEWQEAETEICLPARAILVATGAKTNVAYEFEHRGTFDRSNNFQYQTFRDEAGKLHAVPLAEHCKQADFGAFTSYQRDGHRVSFLGDTHPVFHGSVVKAIASGQRIYPHIVQLFGEQAQQHGELAEYQAFRARMDDLFSARVVSLQRHSPAVLEVTVRAPMAARNFQVGQFFRVQNYETLAPVVHDTCLQTEAIAMLGAGVDPERGEIRLMVLEKGASSRLYATFRPEMPLALMGPTGVHAMIPKEPETIMVIGGRLGAAEMMGLGPILRAAGHKVLYIAGFQTADEAYNPEGLAAAADVIVWITALGTPIVPQRAQDYAATGQFIEVLRQYADGELNGTPAIPLSSVQRVFVIGSNQLLQQVSSARQGALKAHFAHQPAFFASVYGSMQCMLKGVCAQCLQWQIDPETGKRTKAVFACSWQMQPMEMVDLDNLDERLSQNRLQEHLSNLWLDYLFAREEIERV